MSNTINIGDYVTAYCLEEYDVNLCGEEMNPLIDLVLIYSSTGKPDKSKSVYTCDRAYCKDARTAILLELDKLKQLQADLESAYLNLK